MSFNVGFTGTQKGMTPEQTDAVADLIKWYPTQYEDLNWHDGDCIGADTEAHVIAKHAHYFLVGHPPDNPQKRAFNHYDVTWPVKPYLTRNRDIANVAHVLLATPHGMTEELRSGTWSTIRVARARIIPVYIVFPDGSINEENM